MNKTKNSNGLSHTATGSKSILRLNVQGINLRAWHGIETFDGLDHCRYISDMFEHRGKRYVLEVRSWVPEKQQLGNAVLCLGEPLALGERIFDTTFFVFENDGTCHGRKFDFCPDWWQPCSRPNATALLETIKHAIGKRFKSIEIKPMA